MDISSQTQAEALGAHQDHLGSLSPGTEQSSLQLTPYHPPAKRIFCSHLAAIPFIRTQRAKLAGLCVDSPRAFIGRLVHGPPSDLCISSLREILHNLAPPAAVSLSEASLEKAHTIPVRRSLLLTLGHEDQRQVRGQAPVSPFHRRRRGCRVRPSKSDLRLSAHCRSSKDIIKRLYGLSPRALTLPTATQSSAPYVLRSF